MEADKTMRAFLDHQRQEELNLEKVRRTWAWQVEQHTRWEAELQQINDESTLLSKEFKELEDEIKRARETLRIRTQALAEQSLDEIQARVAHWNTQAAVNNQALREAQSRIEERRATVQRVTSNLAKLQTRLEDISKNQGL